MAISDQLEDAIVTRITTLGLMLGATAVTVQRKKAPKTERGLEATPLIQVTSSPQAGRNVWWDTGTSGDPGRKRVEYNVEITLSTPGNRDPESEQDTYRDWRQSIMRAFEPPSVLGIAELYDVEVNPDVQYDRAGFTRNYDQSTITLRMVTIEPASN